MILGAAVVVGVLIVVDVGVSDADIVYGRRRNSSQIVLVQVNGAGCFAEVALAIFLRCFLFLTKSSIGW